MMIDAIDLQMNMIHLKVKSDELDCSLYNAFLFVQKGSLVSLKPAAVEGCVVEDHRCHLPPPWPVDQGPIWVKNPQLHTVKVVVWKSLEENKMTYFYIHEMYWNVHIHMIKDSSWKKLCVSFLQNDQIHPFLQIPPVRSWAMTSLNFEIPGPSHKRWTHLPLANVEGLSQDSLLVADLPPKEVANLTSWNGACNWGLVVR